MVSPVPKHLRTDAEHATIASHLIDHVVDLSVDRSSGVDVPGSGAHRAKYAPGLATALLKLAGTIDVGDPMAGTGMLAWETGNAVALNDIDLGMRRFLNPLSRWGCEVTSVPATEIGWHREVCIFSPPYYPKADRRKPAAHDDAKRGPVVGFRDSYAGDHPEFVGNPGGVNAILTYREQMTRIYGHLRSVCNQMIVVTKNWTRLGVEMRLDLDTILMAQSVGWTCTDRHGWEPPPSLWSRYNAQRGGGVQVEDIMVFSHGATLVRAKANGAKLPTPIRHKSIADMTEQERRIEAAIILAVQYGGIDGAHHKAWVIDQIVRELAGDRYDGIIAEAKNGEDGPETYEWDCGIAP